MRMYSVRLRAAVNMVAPTRRSLRRRIISSRSSVQPTQFQAKDQSPKRQEENQRKERSNQLVAP